MPKAGALASPRSLLALEPVQEEGEGEDEERLAGLLEGALGEVGGAEVGDRDEDRGEHPAPRAEIVERGQGDERGEDADREDLADEGLAEADARQGGDAPRPGRAVPAGSRLPAPGRGRCAATRPRPGAGRGRC